MRTLALVLLIINTVLSAIVAGFHAYWAFGGTLFTDRVLPEYRHNLKPQIFNFSRRPNNKPTMLDCLMVVGAFIVYVALLWTCYLGIWPTLSKALLWVAVAIFALRTIGEHNVVGLFRRENDTLFGHWDKLLYTPFCIWLAVTTTIQILA